jgi:hypothetical protein
MTAVAAVAAAGNTTDPGAKGSECSYVPIAIERFGRQIADDAAAVAADAVFAYGVGTAMGPDRSRSHLRDFLDSSRRKRRMNHEMGTRTGNVAYRSVA